METRKKNLSLRGAFILGILIILTLGLLGRTIAKYTTTKSITANARVAEFKVGLEATQDGETFNSDPFTLGNPLYDNWPDNSGFTVDSDFEANKPAKEEDVWSNKGEKEAKPIAPGTSSIVVVKLTNDSEVSVKAKLKLGLVKISGVTEYEGYSAEKIQNMLKEAIQFRIERTNGSDEDWKSLENISEVSRELDITEKDNKEIAIAWRWLFERPGKDEEDTILGKVAAKGELEIEMDVQAQFDQLD